MKNFDTYHFWNLEQLIFQAAQYYGEGNAEYDHAMAKNVNAVIDRLNLPIFSPTWKEDAEKDALTLQEPHNLETSAEIIGRFFTEYVKKGDCWRDRTSHDFYDVAGTDEANVYRNYVRVLAGIRAIIPATA